MAQPPNPAPTLRLISATGNLLGAVVAFLYFRVVDPSTTGGSRPGLREIVYSIVIFAALVGIGQAYSSRWMAPLARAGLGEPLPPREAALVRRRALLYPYFLAGLTFTGWIMAGLIYGVGIPFLIGHLTFSQAARQVFGITVIAGGVTTAFIFFAVEHYWRRRLPALLPRGRPQRGAERAPPGASAPGCSPSSCWSSVVPARPARRPRVHARPRPARRRPRDRGARSSTACA